MIRKDKAINNLTDLLWATSKAPRLEIKQIVTEFADSLTEQTELAPPCEIHGCHQEATVEMWFHVYAGGVCSKLQVCEDHAAEELTRRAERRAERPAQKQTSGPQCKKCGGFTTRTRVESHGLCMKCELEAKQEPLGWSDK